MLLQLVPAYACNVDQNALTQPPHQFSTEPVAGGLASDDEQPDWRGHRLTAR